MNINDKIKLRKTSKTSNPRFDSSEWQDYTPGQRNELTKSIPVEYEIEGILLSEIEVGFVVSVFRTKRNGIESTGLFQTSPITKILETDAELGKYEIHTENSVYQSEPV